jgi:hypothetical protein
MARYDHGWSAPHRGSETEGMGRSWEEPGSGPRGGGEWFSRPVYGPERYGLGPYHERLRRRRRPDDEVEREVSDALFYDTWIDADAITAEVRDGVVTLRGTLPTYEEIRYAIDDAWDVDGVLGVHSEMDVGE